MKRYGDWFLTFTGKQFWPLDPRPEDFCIEDIAHGLANICRFNGHCRQFYSVAQHSVMVSDGAPKVTFQALMHDAPEAYLGDMIRPLKVNMPAYREAEHRVWVALCARWNIDPYMDPSVKVADNRSLMTERRDLMAESDHEWSLAKDFPPYIATIVPLAPFAAERLFLSRYRLEVA